MVCLPGERRPERHRRKRCLLHRVADHRQGVRDLSRRAEECFKFTCLFPVRLLDPVPVVGINVNDDDRSVARRDQRGLVEAGAAGLVGGIERRRLGKEHNGKF